MPDPPAVPVVSASIDPPPTQEPVIVTVAAPRTGAVNLSAITAAQHPDIIVKAIQPVVIILVRAARVFLQTLMGLLSAATVAPKALPAADFWHLVLLCGSLSVASAGVCVIQNSIELLSRIDQKFPTLSG